MSEAWRKIVSERNNIRYFAFVLGELNGIVKVTIARKKSERGDGLILSHFHHAHRDCDVNLSLHLLLTLFLAPIAVIALVFVFADVQLDAGLLPLEISRLLAAPAVVVLRAYEDDTRNVMANNSLNNMQHANKLLRFLQLDPCLKRIVEITYTYLEISAVDNEDMRVVRRSFCVAHGID